MTASLGSRPIVKGENRIMTLTQPIAYGQDRESIPIQCAYRYSLSLRPLARGDVTKSPHAPGELVLLH
jgi:hypothetical protein